MWQNNRREIPLFVNTSMVFVLLSTTTMYSARYTDNLQFQMRPWGGSRIISPSGWCRFTIHLPSPLHWPYARVRGEHNTKEHALVMQSAHRLQVLCVEPVSFHVITVLQEYCIWYSFVTGPPETIWEMCHPGEVVFRTVMLIQIDVAVTMPIIS